MEEAISNLDIAVQHHLAENFVNCNEGRRQMQGSHSDVVGIQAIISDPSRRGRALQTDGVGPGEPDEVSSTKTCSVLITLDGKACYYI
eukprot:14753387-Ditylum_brightwellii.AAC.1